MQEFDVFAFRDHQASYVLFLGRLGNFENDGF